MTTPKKAIDMRHTKLTPHEAALLAGEVIKPSWASRNEGIHERISFEDTLWGFEMAGGAYYKTPLRVAYVRPDSRAEKACIRMGDTVLRINGQETTDLTLQEAHKLVLEAGINLKIVVTAPEDKFNAHYDYEDPLSVSQGLTAEQLREMELERIRRALERASRCREFKWPWIQKNWTIYRESNCFMVPSKYENKHRELFPELPALRTESFFPAQKMRNVNSKENPDDNVKQTEESKSIEEKNENKFKEEVEEKKNHEDNAKQTKESKPIEENIEKEFNKEVEDKKNPEDNVSPTEESKPIEENIEKAFNKEVEEKKNPEHNNKQTKDSEPIEKNMETEFKEEEFEEKFEEIVEEEVEEEGEEEFEEEVEEEVEEEEEHEESSKVDDVKSEENSERLESIETDKNEFSTQEENIIINDSNLENIENKEISDETKDSGYISNHGVNIIVNDTGEEANELKVNQNSDDTVINDIVDSSIEQTNGKESEGRSDDDIIDSVLNDNSDSKDTHSTII